jgi:hypothetical protein
VPGSVRGELPGGVVGERRVEDDAEPLLGPRVLDRDDDLEPFSKEEEFRRLLAMP